MVTNATTGTVRFSSPSHAFATVTVPVTDGGFDAPTIASIAGLIKAKYTGPGVTLSETFTKDSSDYSLVLSGPASPPPPPPPPPATVSFVQSAGAVGKTVSLDAPAKTGDLLVLSASLYTGATKRITSIEDGGDIWKSLTPSPNGYSSGHDSDGELWYTVAKGGETEITV